MSSSNAGAFTSNASPPGPGPIDEKSSGDTLIQSSSAQSRLPTLPWWKISRKTLVYLRLLIFIILETGYIILAAVCLAKPVPLSIHHNLTVDDVEGGFTVVFVVWQSIAILMGVYFAADAFSREWSFQLAHIAPDSRNSLGAIDSVSTMTSGFIDRTYHLLFSKSSGTFKLAFLASISLVALRSLAPGTINVATTLIDLPITLSIGRLVLSHASDDGFEKSVTTQDRANLILRLEMIEHSPFGFKLEPNMLTVVPKVDLDSFNGTIEYNSDVIEFHHDCHWEAPQFFNNSEDGVIVAAANQQWRGATVGTGLELTNPGSSVGPLSLASFPIMEAVGTSAFIFSGGNTSILVPQSNPPTPFAIDLGSLPTTFNASGAGLNMDPYSLYAPLSSILICDPRLKISGGRIRITNDGTLKVIRSGETPIGNIPRSAANLIFTNAFQLALWLPESFSPNAVNNVASIMFMANSSTVDWKTARNIRPLDLPSINKNMDTFMLSAAKAYIDGYTRISSNPVAEYNLDTVSAMGQREAYALLTSKGLFIAIVALIAIATLLLLAILTSTQKKERLPFDLNNVFNALREEGGTRGSFAFQNK